MSKIPKQIFVCHKTKDIVETHSAPLWRALNPDYTIHRYGDEEIEEFFRTHCPELYLHIFRYIQDPPIKSDFWRLCILHTFGGFYVDADIHPLVPISSWLEPSATFVTCVSSDDTKEKRNMNPHIVACEPGNPLLLQAINMYKQYYERKRPYSYWTWSIVTVFNPMFTRLFFGKPLRDGLFGTIQLLQEVRDTGNKYDDCCKYKHQTIVMNRQASYDYRSHTFSEPCSKIDQPTP